ncbi:predicted protein [Arabidopsis lyrata subsp. lyrata]|uniref:Predicted protein n=1 Tax=Arabidopsis lyrata subsp. lyrata TaxID=81972 RepID=D7M6X9_ARALL|nr:predicted protein [Arabidopsis lyrata subsp. lyrata]
MAKRLKYFTISKIYLLKCFPFVRNNLKLGMDLTLLVYRPTRIVRNVPDLDCEALLGP